MKLENNWRQKSLESLEKRTLALDKNEGSYLIKTCSSLRKKPLQDFTTEDLRIMIGQEIGLAYLIPLALETLDRDLFAEGDFYEGDLLNAVFSINTDYWNKNKIYWQTLQKLTINRRLEIQKKKISSTNYDNCIHGQ